MFVGIAPADTTGAKTYIWLGEAVVDLDLRTQWDRPSVCTGPKAGRVCAIDAAPAKTTAPGTSVRTGPVIGCVGAADVASDGTAGP